MKALFITFCISFVVQQNHLLAQYENYSYKDFFELDTLNKSIVLNENFDYLLVQQGVMHYTNRHRNSKKVHALKYHFLLQNAADLHSEQMNKYNFFNHINPYNKNLKTLENRAKYAGYQNYTYLAENIYHGYIDLSNLPTYADLIQTITEAFIHSKTHNINLLNKQLNEVGIAILFESKSDGNYLYYYVTQSFGSQY